MRDAWKGRRVLVTGGLGFIGSSVAVRLGEAGARVTIVDALVPQLGGNRYNIAPVADRVAVIVGDVRDRQLMESAVEDQDVVFHFAAQVSHLDSMDDPERDLDLTLRGTLNVLEACRYHNPAARIVTVGSRMQFGDTGPSPVAEDHAMRPRSIYGLHKLVVEHYCRLYREAFGLWTTVLRLSTPFGPRQQVRHGKYGVISWFVRLGLEGRPLTVFGDGVQRRDYFYIDDAVDVFLAAALDDAAAGEVFNVGGGRSISFREMAETVARATGVPVDFVPWPPQWKGLEDGDYVSDIGKARRLLGWAPRVPFEEGIRRTIAYYRASIEQYR